MDKFFAFRRARPFGFTLIELMVAVAVIGILAAIAYPSYRQYIVKSNRTAAQSHLMDIAQREQQYFLDSRTYASTVTDLKLTTPAKVAGLYTIDIAVSASTPVTFIATATPIGGTAQANDVVLSINSAGTKSPADKW